MFTPAPPSVMHLIWNPSRGALPYGCEIIAEKADFLSRPKSAEFESPELVDRDDEIPF